MPWYRFYSLAQWRKQMKTQWTHAILMSLSVPVLNNSIFRALTISWPLSIHNSPPVPRPSPREANLRDHRALVVLHGLNSRCCHSALVEGYVLKRVWPGPSTHKDHKDVCKVPKRLGEQTRWILEGSRYIETYWDISWIGQTELIPSNNWAINNNLHQINEVDTRPNKNIPRTSKN